MITGMGGLAILVENGGTVKNCDISGFEVAIQVGDGENTVKDTMITNVSTGIEVKGDGCNTIETVKVTKADLGILIIPGGGTVSISDYTAIAAIYGILVDVETTTVVAVTDSSIQHTLKSGVYADGDVQLDFYGSNTISNTGGNGILLIDGPQLNIYGDTQVLLSGSAGIVDDGRRGSVSI